MRRISKGLVLLGALALLVALPSTARAGSIYLTGHDVLLHDGQNGYDSVILDFLRGAGTGSEIAAASYSIAVVGSGVGSWGWSDAPGFDEEGAKPGYESTTYYDTDTMGDAEWADALTRDVLVILSHTTCGGCDLTTAGSAAINARAAQIADAFNLGMDIYANSGATLGTYYDFLPPGSTATGVSIGASCGFVATAAGLGIGIDGDACGATSHINGFPTHNRFASISPVFTVFEVRPITGAADEIISIGVRDATIVDTGIVTGETPVIPEPGTLLLLGTGLAVAARRYRRKTQQ